MVKHKICTPEERAEICQLYLSTNMTMKEIAQQYQISEKSIQRFLKEAKSGFKPKPKSEHFNGQRRSYKKDQITNDFVDSNMRNRDSSTGELITSQNYALTHISKPS